MEQPKDSSTTEEQQIKELYYNRFKKPILDHFCRICLRKSSKLYWVDKEHGNLQGLKKIVSIIFITYDLSIEPESKICEECLVKVDICYGLRLEAQRTNIVYNDILKRSRPSIGPITLGRMYAKTDKVDELPEIVDLSNEIESKDEEREKEVEEEEPDLPKMDEQCLMCDTNLIENSIEKTRNVCTACDLLIRDGVERKGLQVVNDLADGYELEIPSDEKSFRCYLCNTKVSDESHFEEHKDAKLSCDSCKENPSFQTVKELNVHLAYHDPRRSSKCRYCFKRFFSFKDRKLHELAHSKRKIATIEANNQKAKNDKFPPIKKKYQEREIDPTPCPHCGKLFKKRTLLKLHESRIHDKTSGVLCHICDKKVYGIAQLKIHLTLHTNEKRFVCEFCGMGFRLRQMYINHRRLHTKELPYHCDDCNRDFRTRAWFKKHKLPTGCRTTRQGRWLEQSKFYRFSCRVCEFKAASEAEFKDHMSNKHQQSDAFICGYCNDTFSDFELYKEHVVVDHSNKPDGHSAMEFYLPCPHCYKVYHKKGYMANHLSMMHSGKMFKCDLCDRDFSMKANLQRHVDIVHLKKRLAECDICLKKFGAVSQMKTHRRTHTGEKPYSCNICDLSYSDYSTLFKHNKKFHNDLLKKKK